MPDGLPDYYPQQLEALRAIARAAQALAADIRSWFPVEGAAWTLEGSPSDGGAVGIVAYSAARLDRLLYPLRLCFDASIYDYVCFLNPENPPEQWPKRLHPREIRGMKKRPFRVSDTAVRYAFGAFAGGPREVEAHCRQALPVSQDFHAAVLAVMASHDRLLGHYGWGAWVGNDAAKDKRAWPWDWPDVPPVPQRLVEGLERAAGRLGGLTAEPPPAGWEFGPGYFRYGGGRRFDLPSPIHLRLLQAFVEAAEMTLANNQVNHACDPKGYGTRPDQWVSELNRHLRRLGGLRANAITACGKGSRSHRLTVPAAILRQTGAIP